jgi:regulatory protein
VSQDLDEWKKLKGLILRWLARREHSAREIQQKLMRDSSVNLELINQVIAELVNKEIISDRRFAESFIRYRVRQGCGPIKIAMELRERGVEDQLVTQGLDEYAQQWANHIQQVHQKRFGELADDHKKWAKQARFLQQRGFTVEQIRTFLASSTK